MLPTSGFRRCDPLAGVPMLDGHELASELCRVRWSLHCELGKLDRAEAERARLATKVEALRAREAQLVGVLVERDAEALALADATSMHWRCSPLYRAPRERDAEAKVFAALDALGIAVKGDGDR